MQRLHHHSTPIHAFAIVLFVACAGFPHALGAEAAAPAIRADRGEQSLDLAKLFDAVVDTVEQRFFDVTRLREVDWQAHAAAIRPFVLSAASTEDAVRRINGLLSELKTSHTWLFTPDEYDYYALLDVVGGTDVAELMSRRFWGSGPYYPGIGAFTREMDGRHFVDGILEGSPAQRAGLKYGDEILSVDGTPYSPISAFRDKIGTTAELSIRRSSEADPQHLAVSVVPIRPTTAFSQATEASARVIERNGSRVGYIHIWASSESKSFGNALSKLEMANVSDQTGGRRDSAGNIVATFNTPNAVPNGLKPIDFLIVDMRGRVGGNIAVAGQFLDLMVEKQKPYWGSWRVIDRRDAAGRMVGAARKPPFRGGSALLIDHHTRSAAEIMAHGYKRGGFGTVVGTATAGAVSSGALFVMAGDLLLYVAVAGHEFDGNRLEGVGVIPDHRVERPLPYAAGADPVLDVAVEILTQTPK